MIILVLIILLNCKQHLAEVDFCKMEPTHLLCSTDNKDGDYLPVMDEVTDLDKKDLLHQFNILRNKAGLGALETQDGKNVNLKSSSMNALKWDSTLEEMATVHINSGTFGKFKPEQALIDKFQAVGLVAMWNENNFNLNQDKLAKWQNIINIEKKRLKKGFSLANDYQNARDASVISYNPQTPNDQYKLTYIGNILLLLRDEYYLIGCSSGVITAGGAQYLEILYFFVCYLGPDEPQESYDLWTVTGKGGADCSTKTTTIYIGLCDTDQLPSAVDYKKIPNSIKLPPESTKPATENAESTANYNFGVTAFYLNPLFFTLFLSFFC